MSRRESANLKRIRRLRIVVMRISHSGLAHPLATPSARTKKEEPKQRRLGSWKFLQFIRTASPSGCSNRRACSRPITRQSPVQNSMTGCPALALPRESQRSSLKLGTNFKTWLAQSQVSLAAWPHRRRSLRGRQLPTPHTGTGCGYCATPLDLPGHTQAVTRISERHDSDSQSRSP